jgi:hypothetical protein
MLMDILDSSWDHVPFVDKSTSFTWAPQSKLDASVNMEFGSGRTPKILLIRVLEGEFPDPEGPGVVSIWRAREVEEVKGTTSHVGLDLPPSLVGQ